MSIDIIAIVIAGAASLAALATFFTKASFYLTVREHDIYAHNVERRLERIENKLNGGVWKNTHE